MHLYQTQREAAQGGGSTSRTLGGARQDAPEAGTRQTTTTMFRSQPALGDGIRWFWGFVEQSGGFLYEACKLNSQEVVEEDKRLKLPPNWEAKKARLEWELQVQEKKKECAARGEDYERVKLLEISAEDAERWERKKKRKNPDLGFSDYAAAQLRQYQRLTRQIKPDLEQYEKLKEQYGEALYPTSDSLLHGTHVPSKEGVDRMVADLEKQIEKREKYSRRRPYNDDADIDYINERNAKFNQKAERFYGKYTAEIKQNLERGTAV
ncbi:PREDICTED: pre-mRNA-splicing factor SYF2 [Corvus brachyrhynchos]|nr:PREDICTED: pre-mRNA-splicing factor SYF2 [Corvus brachyrhynchos]